MEQSSRANIDSAASATFAANVKAARESAGMSQRALSSALAELGVTLYPSAITRLEQGEREVRIGEAVALSHVLGEPLSRLVGEDENPAETLSMIREDTNRAMRRARQSLVSMLQGFAVIQSMLREHPDLLGRLADESDQAPGSVEGYLPWVRGRLQRLTRGWDPAVADTAEDVEHLRKIASSLIGHSVALEEVVPGLDEWDDDPDGFVLAAMDRDDSAEFEAQEDQP